ncbi:MAG: DUF547 domain-containing protein [Rubripirellula sp.]
MHPSFFNVSSKLLIVALLWGAILQPGDVMGGNEVYVGKQSRSNLSMDDVSHSGWDQLLQKYVNDQGQVNYRSWKASRADVQALDAYLALLSTAGRSAPATREAKLAFWINAYNAVTIRGILREYPTSSIRNHTAKLWGYNIWKHLQLYVGGVPVSLNSMEHEILRKMDEPRIHFAIVCASIGCPRLLRRAYVAEKVNSQLESNAKDFFSRSQNFRYDPSNQKVYLSEILDWFGEDFGDGQVAQLRRIAGWLPEQAGAVSEQPGAIGVSYLDYDWNLNQQ